MWGLFLVGFFAILPVALIAVAIKQYVRNAKMPTLTRRVQVIHKRTEPVLRSSTPRYLCLVEFAGGERAEYEVYDRGYLLMNSGDFGDLDTRGRLFWGYRRVADSGDRPEGD